MARCARARVAQVKERLVRVWAESAAARAPAQARTFTRNVKDATARASTSAHAQTGPVSETMAAGGADNCYFVTHGFDLSAPRFSIEKPARLNVSVSPRPRNVTSARIHSLLIVLTKKGDFFS